MIIDAPPNTMPCIKDIWAFLSVDENGNEGVCASFSPTHGWMPLIAADQARLDMLRPIAANLARQSTMRIRLVRFSTREVVETIDGGH